MPQVAAGAAPAGGWLGGLLKLIAQPYAAKVPQRIQPPAGRGDGCPSVTPSRATLPAALCQSWLDRMAPASH